MDQNLTSNSKENGNTSFFDKLFGQKGLGSLFGANANGGGFFQMLMGFLSSFMGGFKDFGKGLSGENKLPTNPDIPAPAPSKTTSIDKTSIEKGPSPTVSLSQERSLPERIGSGIRASWVGLLDLIGVHESAGDYNRVYSARGVKKADVTNMTLNQVLDYQKKYVQEQADRGVPPNYRSSAIGKYQINKPTLVDLMKGMGLKGDEVMDESMQDKMAAFLIQHRALDKSGKIDQNKLANIWASMPKEDGRGAYDHVGTNKASNISKKLQHTLAVANEEIIVASADPSQDFQRTDAKQNKVAAHVDPQKGHIVRDYGNITDQTTQNTVLAGEPHKTKPGQVLDSPALSLSI